jgi:hypothetical protein
VSTAVGERPAVPTALSDEQATQMMDVRPHVVACPVCHGVRLHYAFGIHGFRAVRCAECHTLMLNPQPSNAELRAIYTDTYFISDPNTIGESSVSSL